MKKALLIIFDMPFAIPSLLFKNIFPLNPSQTQTSTTPFNNSLGSTNPIKFIFLLFDDETIFLPVLFSISSLAFFAIVLCYFC